MAFITVRGHFFRNRISADRISIHVISLLFYRLLYYETAGILCIIRLAPIGRGIFASTRQMSIFKTIGLRLQDTDRWRENGVTSFFVANEKANMYFKDKRKSVISRFDMCSISGPRRKLLKYIKAWFFVIFSDNF